MLTTFLRKLWLDRRGQDLIEYALIVGFLCTAIAVMLPWAVIEPATHVMSAIGVRMASLNL